MTFTSVPVKPETLARLKTYKTGGRSYDEVLNEILDEFPPEAFMKEHFRRLAEEPRSTLTDVKARLKKA